MKCVYKYIYILFNYVCNLKDVIIYENIII